MSDNQHGYVSSHYAPRAAAYGTSAVHAGGADLDQVEAIARACPGARVLDLGCGGGHVGYRAAPHVGAVVAYDLTADMLAEVEQGAMARGLGNLTTRQGAAERLPFDDASFDLVLCRFTAHHWQDFEAGLREARRVLAPAGRAVFIDVVSPERAVLDTHLQTLELLRDPSHGRNYTAAQWVSALARAGFAVAGTTARKLRMEFDVWTVRTGTPEPYRTALRLLQVGASEAVRRHFDIGPDGSFDLDTLTLEVTPC